MLRRVISSRWSASHAAAAARFVTITPVPMPSLSPTMTEGTLSQWKKQVGDSIVPGDQLALVQTDKASMSFDNVGDEGFMARHIVPEGTEKVPVGSIVALFVDNKADINSPEVAAWTPSATAAAPKAAAPAAAEAAPVAAAAASSAVASNAAPGSRVFASPLARKTANELGVNVAAVVGTGGAVGRVTKADVVKAAGNPAAAKSAAPAAAAAATPVSAAAAPAAAAAPSAAAAAPAAAAAENFERIAVTPMRKVIAQRLTQSKNIDVPHYYLMQDCRADNMNLVIKQLNAKGNGEYKITVNDFIIKAIARANLIVPECNTHWYGDHLRRYSAVDVSVAVATPTGLITPIIRDAHVKGLVQISNEVKALAKLAREGKLQPNQYQGGTVSVSNLGGMGIDQFTAIINPPQSMILAVGTAQPKPEIIKGEDGEFAMTGKVLTAISFTASFDHRVVDGAVGAQWFKHFKDTVENPLSLLL